MSRNHNHGSEEDEDEWGGNDLGFEPKRHNCLRFCGCGVIALVVILAIVGITIQFAVIPVMQKTNSTYSQASVLLDASSTDQARWQFLADWGWQKAGNLSSSTISWAGNLVKGDLIKKIPGEWQNLVDKIKSWKK
jgi:hypothetical protein